VLSSEGPSWLAICVPGLFENMAFGHIHFSSHSLLGLCFIFWEFLLTLNGLHCLFNHTLCWGVVLSSEGPSWLSICLPGLFENVAFGHIHFESHSLLGLCFVFW
jgi:hypothetical protein